MNNFLAKTKTRSQVADEYGITPRTLRRWIKKYNINLPPGLICPKDQKKIYEKLGTPLENNPQEKRISKE